jgi:ADP-ribose pyrophosphatase YjhB (NUDIX family)
MDNDVRFAVAAAGVVTDSASRILLIKTLRAGWELPRGRVEQGEDLIGALKREVQEECGCQVAVDRLVGVSSNTESSSFISFTFACRHLGGGPSAGDDSLAAAWFPPDEAVQLVTHPAERARLQDALAHAPGVRYRVYGQKAHHEL